MCYCQVCLALPPSPRWCFPSPRPPSEMWNSKGPLKPAHQAPCVELSSDVTLKSRPHPKYIRQHLQTNVPKGPLMVDYPYETILNMFHMNSAHSNQIYQNHLACILTVHGIQMDSILSNEYCIRDFKKIPF